jgi:hypothetical protein
MTENQSPEVQKVPAFDVKDLVERLKSAGLPLAEEAAHAVVKSVFDWVEYGVKETPTPIDDVALALMPPLRAFIDSKLDGISK